MKNPFTRNQNDTPDLEGLKEFEGSSDRDYARFFVGRTTVLGDIDKAWRRRMTAWSPSNATAFSSATRIVQGAPGAGKTSVGARLERELWNPDHPDYIFRRAGEKASHVVRLDPKTLNGQMEVFIKICQVIKPGSVKKTQEGQLH